MCGCDILDVDCLNKEFTLKLCFYIWKYVFILVYKVELLY